MSPRFELTKSPGFSACVRSAAIWSGVSAPGSSRWVFNHEPSSVSDRREAGRQLASASAERARSALLSRQPSTSRPSPEPEKLQRSSLHEAPALPPRWSKLPPRAVAYEWRPPPHSSRTMLTMPPSAPSP